MRPRPSLALLTALLVSSVLAVPTAPRAETALSVAVLRPVRAGDLLSPDLLGFVEAAAPDAFADPRDVAGLEARVNLYPGRPLLRREVGRPAVIERNAVVPLIFRRGGLTILLDGRALGRAAPGEAVRVMNLASRTTVTGVATADGRVELR